MEMQEGRKKMRKILYNLLPGETDGAKMGTFIRLSLIHIWLPGAAMATALSQSLGGLIPLVYFSRPNGSLFRLGKASLDKRALAKACINGSS